MNFGRRGLRPRLPKKCFDSFFARPPFGRARSENQE